MCSGSPGFPVSSEKKDWTGVAFCLHPVELSKFVLNTDPFILVWLGNES